MNEKNPEVFNSPTVQDKRIIPSGGLPRNIQAWMLGGLAAVMVVVIALSGANSPKPRSIPDPLAAVDPSAARIQEYKKRIEEQTRKLQQEQAALPQIPGGAGGPSGNSSAAFSQTIPRSVSGMDGDVPRGYPIREVSATDKTIQAEKEKREYQSLFASNVALSLRSEVTPAPVPPASSVTDELTRILSLNAALAALPTSLSASAPAAPAAPTQSSLPPKGPEPPQKIELSFTREGKGNATEQPVKSGARQGIADDPPGTYRVYEGTVLESALSNRLDGSFSGPVNCMVTTDLYSQDGRHLLVPQGSRVLGEVRKVESFGQERLAVFFHRLIMPDGYSVNLDQFQGLSQVGETGLRDQVNHHYFQVFGVSLAIGAIAGLGQSYAGTGVDRSALDNYEQGVSTSLSQSSLRILDRYLNVLPTFTIREGLRVKIFLSQDLLLPAYDRHQPDKH